MVDDTFSNGIEWSKQNTNPQRASPNTTRHRNMQTERNYLECHYEWNIRILLYVVYGGATGSRTTAHWTERGWTFVRVHSEWNWFWNGLRPSPPTNAESRRRKRKNDNSCPMVWTVDISTVAITAWSHHYTETMPLLGHLEIYRWFLEGHWWNERYKQ